MIQLWTCRAKVVFRDAHKYIHIISNYRNEPSEEKKYYFKDINISYSPGRYGNFYIRFKVIPEGSVGNFKTKYMIRNQKGWNREDAKRLIMDLKAWKEGLLAMDQIS